MTQKSIFFGLLFSLLLISCIDNTENTKNQESTSTREFYQIVGEAQGTTYAIIFNGTDDLSSIKSSIDSLLTAYDMENSIYQPMSLISTLNQSSDSLFSFDQFASSNNFTSCFNIAKEVHSLTNAAFNPAVYPLVKYWGFHGDGYNLTPDSADVDSLLLLTDFSNNNYHLDLEGVHRMNINTKIDFNAIAQGHSVDVVSNYLEFIGIDEYMIEIGGEVRCKGLNPDGNNWTIGIDKPVENGNPGENGFQFIASISNLSLATSGNYRKFYEVDGQKFSHTINPENGYPAKQNLLSVTVITEQCAYADAYATAFMVMGLDESKAFIEEHPSLGLSAYFVYDDNGKLEVEMTPNFEKYILN